ncbi:LysR family transcriptional regulator [Pandoraea apista]|uniref:LysR family transcriptional regulator n=1 Tax=Pandoraea apista TaxID=93218 RepID=A0ABX9ZT37_9BURK|nr:LysR family transcriptional regulator [Pandoraea apista]AJE99066.1 LysR family transcriptional regulator [Pandoraea apista]AKH73161.1 LysR family transcriptional regulator [Pandoraea apista]AKI61557.1 LysR family transcriptional regulator [Pandoraea apista]AVF39772.1 LysR family transcriptional regulator [Pandoraea apista]PTE01157.1 LysR family transcriptional regulator [Pandoraea apista]
MTPDQLLTFATVAELGNISHAAQALHLSQPAVSGQLRLLQESFGEPLYRRDGRGIRLTAVGEQVAVYANKLRQDYRQALALRDSLRGMETGALRIGASTTPASYLLPYVIAEFHQRYPAVALHIVDGNTSEIVAQLDRLDVAFIEGAVPPGLSPEIAVRPWRDDEVVAIARVDHPLTKAPEGASLQAIADYPLIMREPGSGVRALVARAFSVAGLTPRVALELAGVESIKEAVRAGMGVGFVSAMSMRHEDAALVSVRIDPPHGLKRLLTALVPHADALSRPTERFLAQCFAGDAADPAAVR